MVNNRGAKEIGLPVNSPPIYPPLNLADVAAMLDDPQHVTVENVINLVTALRQTLGALRFTREALEETALCSFNNGRLCWCHCNATAPRHTHQCDKAVAALAGATDV